MQKMNDLANDIRQARIRGMMSQAHLAEVAGVSERTVKRAEAGDPISAETLRAIRAVLGDDLAPRTDTPGPRRFAGLVPPPITIQVDGPTGFLTLDDDPVRTGIAHGILTGLSIPNTCRGAEGFLEEYGPDAALSSEAETALALRGRLWWIDLAGRKAESQADREMIAHTRIEARRLILEAERAEASVRSGYRAWYNRFASASLAARISARAVQVFAMLAAAIACPGGLAASLVAALGVFVATAVVATVEITIRFDTAKARDVKGRLIEARHYRQAYLVIETHASGLIP
jgi:DNA-binding XRE family transcriptional regulator